MEIPVAVATFIEKRSEDGEVHDPCEKCNGHCCSAPGFARLENVLEIFKQYENGQLTRTDFQFEQGLNVSKFIWRYFDRVVHQNRLLTLVPKTFTSDFGIVSVPPTNYYHARAQIRKKTGSRGCVFLSRLLEKDGAANNLCILHTEAANRTISQKPIDCLFLHCDAAKQVLRPTLQDSIQWISMLDQSFPNSLARFQEICPGMPDQTAEVFRQFRAD